MISTKEQTIHIAWEYPTSNKSLERPNNLSGRYTFHIFSLFAHLQFVDIEF